MLSQETAVGAYPVGAVAMMSAIAEQTESASTTSDWNEHRVTPHRPGPRLHRRVRGLRAARELDLDALVVPTLSGRSARLVSAHRPNVPIFALSPGRETVRRCGLMWGVSASWMRRHEIDRGADRDAAGTVVRLGWCKPGQRVGITAGLPSGTPGTTSLLQIQRV